MNRLLSLLLLLCITLPAPAQTPAKEQVLLFSFFRLNGQDGLYLAWSEDGLTFNPLNNDKPLLKPAVGGKLMRDPCIARGPDGVFHMTWTPGWSEQGIGLAHSKDLIQWSEQKLLPVMKYEPTARNAWAPELFYDAAGKQFLIFWASTIPGRFKETEAAGDKGWNHRMYFTTTKDFEAFSPTKLFYDGGFNVIDATIVRDADKHVMILKDETKTPTKKNLRLATADKAEGPWSPAGAPFSPDWVEGPTCVKIGEHWYVYYDEYTRRHYGAMRTKDWKTWETMTDKLQMPKGARHGTVLWVEQEVVKKVMEGGGKK